MPFKCFYFNYQYELRHDVSDFGIGPIPVRLMAGSGQAVLHFWLWQRQAVNETPRQAVTCE